MINIDGSGLLDIRFNAEDECPDIFEKCCQQDFVDLMGYQPPDHGPVEAVCGRKGNDGIGFRITNQHDNEADFGEFPWMAAILKGEYIGDELLSIFQCGGSLIHPSVVLTGAFCAFTFEKALNTFSS